MNNLRLMMVSSSRLALLVAMGAASMPASAQLSATDKQPEVILTDDNGVDLRTGELSTSAFKTSIGEKDDPTFFLTSLRAGSAAPTSTPFFGRVVGITCTQNTSGYCSTTRRVEYNGYSRWFNGATSFEGDQLGTEGSLLVLTLRDGTRIRFDPAKSPARNPNASEYEAARIIDITKPNGEAITYSNFTASGPKYASSNRGYAAILRETSDLNAGSSTSTLTFVNTSKVYCSNVGTCNSSAITWPSATQAITNSGATTTEKATDTLNRTATHTSTQGSGFVDHSIVERDGRSYSFRHKIYQYFSGTTPYYFIPLVSFTRDTNTTTYSYNVTNVANNGVTVTYANGETKKVRFSGRSVFVQNGTGKESEANYFYAASSPGGLGLTSAPLSSLMSYYVFPEGNRIDYSYDARGNITTMTVTPKPGSGQPVLTSTASYPASCTNPKTCNKPDYVIDLRGARTDYQYSPDHGGILTKTEPANTNGVRAQTRYEYEPRSAKQLNSSGQLVAAAPIWKLVRERTCQTATACDGSADERLTSYEYDDNLLPTSVTTTSGNGSVKRVVVKRYDAVGNVTEVDGAIDGPGDLTRQVYDQNRDLIGILGADPDGSGPLPVSATRFDLDASGRTTSASIGTAANQSDAAFAAMNVLQTISTKYNNAGLKVDERVTADGAVQKVSQFSYDKRNRLDCFAIRMNAAVYGSLPSDACVLGAPGTAGPDRITKTTYDAASRLIQTRKALGTSDEQVYATYAYSDNGNRLVVIDANGARAEMSYDGYDRLVRWNLPSSVRVASFNPTTQTTALSTSGAVSGTDYESYDYDNNRNRTGLRRRDGRYISYSYDNLNRLTSKMVPDGCAPLQVGACPPASATRDTFYAYDLLGYQTEARFDSIGGEGVSNAFDPLGRLRASTTTMGGRSRTLAVESYNDGARKMVSFSGGTWFYKYDNLSRLLTVHEGALSSAALSSWAYNAAGSLSSLTESGGSTVSWSYNGLKQLTGQTDSFVGGLGSTAFGLTYYPSGQVGSLTLSNPDYQFSGAYNVSRSYASNGLNQYSSAGGNQFSYDGNGNLISDKSTSFGYDAENRLISTSTGGRLVYDPLGRIFQITGNQGTTQFFYDGDQLAAEYDIDGNVINRYVHGPNDDDPILWYDRGGSVKWYHRDMKGSIVALAGSAGAMEAINRYDSYGIPDRTNRGRFQYTGQVWLPEIGMYHYKARVYSPTLGRFLQVDPIGYADQINLYAYVGNDPINSRDPTGLECTKDGLICKSDIAPQVDTTVQNSPAMDQAMHDNADQVRVRSGTDEKIGFLAKKDGEEIGFRPAPDAKKGSKGNQDNARAASQPGDVAVIHGHIPGRSDGLVDDTENGRGLGDSQPLTRGLTNGTVMGNRLGVHEIVGGVLQFRMIDGKMTGMERRQIQKNLNDEQRIYR